MGLKLPGEAKKRKTQKTHQFRPYSKKPQPKIKYAKNRQEIHDIAAKAKELGISYGEYVARYDNGT